MRDVEVVVVVSASRSLELASAGVAFVSTLSGKFGSHCTNSNCLLTPMCVKLPFYEF